MSEPHPPADPARLAVRDLRSPLAGPFHLELAAGECVAITGASGSGKSLFLRMIADLDPSEGEARLDGRPRGAFDAPAWRRKLPYVAADAGWWADCVADHFAQETHAAARELADRLGLDAELFDAPVLRLSTGERQRLAVIRALVLDPPVLLLDEPSGALDPASARKLETVLKARLRAGCAMVVVTHEPAQAGRLKAKHLVMHERRLRPAR